MKDQIKTLTIFPDAFICLNCGEVFIQVEDMIDHAESSGHMQHILRREPNLPADIPSNCVSVLEHFDRAPSFHGYLCTHPFREKCCQHENCPLRPYGRLAAKRGAYGRLEQSEGI